MVSFLSVVSSDFVFETDVYFRGRCMRLYVYVSMHGTCVGTLQMCRACSRMFVNTGWAESWQIVVTPLYVLFGLAFLGLSFLVCTYAPQALSCGDV